MRFLQEKRIKDKLEIFFKRKIKKVSRTTIGKDIGISSTSSPEKIPITNWSLYQKYFESPNQGDFLYPLNDYVKVYTSGTMGKPKTILLPKTGLWDNLKKTGLTSMLVSTHDGEKITFEIGDVGYTNIPGGSHLSTILTEMGVKQHSRWVVQCPDPNLSFQAKIDYFIEHYEKIDFVFMTVTTLLDEIYPRIGKPFYLKGFLTQDRSAEILKEEIKYVTGNYPKVTYGSTETMKSTIPSIEHPGGFFFDWRMIYTEFIPEDQKITSDKPIIVEPPETIPMMDVEVGKRYQLIATPFKNDITRYATPDVFNCIDTGDDILNTEAPIFSYYSRADRLIVLHNFTRIAEEELLYILKDAEIPFVDFVVRRELEGARDYMVIYIELSSPMSEVQIFNRLHEKLYDFDKDWRDLTNFMKYVPLKLRLLSRGTFKEYLKTKRGMPRIDRMEINEDRLLRLLKISKK